MPNLQVITMWKHFRFYLLGWSWMVKMQVYNALAKIMVRVTLVVFDLSSEVTDAAIQAVRKQGNLQLEIRFASALPEAINVLLYASFPGEIKIDQARSIQVT